MQRIGMCVQAEVGASESQFREKTLNALSRVPHQVSPNQALGWTRIRSNAEQPSRAVQPTAIKDGSPVVPIELLEGFIGRQPLKESCELDGRSRIKLKH